MLIPIIGALVALLVVLAMSVALSQRLAARSQRLQGDKLRNERAQRLGAIETELEKLEALKSARTAEDNEVYARLIRRRNVLVEMQT